MAGPPTSLPTQRLQHAGDDWFVPPSQLAELALGTMASRPIHGQHSLGRHLAFLPLESLDLDLEDPLQREFGDYVLLDKLGQGGMGVVYRAHQVSLDREVAIKLLAAGPWASADFIERFRREAQSAARMQHPNIVAIHEVGASDDLNYFSMQLVRGESLAALCHREGRLDPRRAARWVRTIAEAVDYAHRLGVLHLDLKPGNVLIDERGEPLVADFGLARRLDETLAADDDEISGTPSYMAPEQALNNGRLQPATDVYGLGAILYELLTGAPPFIGSTPQATLRQVVTDDVVPARRRVRGLPKDLEAICAKCLAKSPEQRYPSARALAEDLGAYLDGRATVVRPIGFAERIARWALRERLQAAMAAMLLLTFLVGFAATTLQGQRAERNAATARVLLWESRRQEAYRLAVEGRGFEAGGLLLSNIADAEAAARTDVADVDRRRLGNLLVQGIRLVDRILVDDASPTAAELSPDGSRLAVGFNDLTVRWYATATLEEQGRVSLMDVPTSEDLGGFHRVPIMLRFVDNDRLRISLEWYDHWIRPGERDTSLVDLVRGRLVRPPDGFDDASFSDDGDYALLHRDGTAQLWQTAPWQALGAAFAVPTPPMPTLLTRGGRYALSLNPSMASFQLRDPRNPERLLTVDLPHDAGLSAWAESRDGRWLAIGDHAGRVHLVDLETLVTRPLRLVLRDEISWITFSEDDAWLAVGNLQGAAMVFDVATGASLLPDSLLHDFPISRLRIVRSQQLLVATGGESTTLWRLPLPGALGHRPHRLHTSPTPVQGAAPYAVAMDADSGLLATASVNGEIRLWRLPPTPMLPGRAAALVPDQPIIGSDRVAEVAYDRVRLVSLDGRPTGDWIAFAEPPSFAEVLPMSRELLVVSGRELHFLDVETLRPKRQVTLPGSPQRLLVGADEHLLVLSIVGSTPGRGFVETLHVVDRASGVLRPERAELQGPLMLRAAGDGQRLLAIGGVGGSSVMLSLPALEVLGRYAHDPDAPVANGAFGADQRTALLVERTRDPIAADDALLLWDPSQQAMPLRRTFPEVEPLAVAAVGGQVYLGGSWRDLLVAAGQDARPVRRLSRAEATSLVAVSRDARWLARAYRYRDIELIDPASGIPLGPPLYWNPGGIQLLTQLAFRADDRMLLARTSQGRRLHWPLAAETRDVAALRRHLAPLIASTEDSSTDDWATAVNDPVPRAALRAGDPGPWPRTSAAPRADSVRRVADEPIPPRSAAATPWMLDLSAVYSLAPTGSWGPRDHVISSLFPLAWGVQRLGGIDYDIRGAVGLNAPSGPSSGDQRVSRATGIGVPAAPVAAFHVLMLAGNRRAETDAREYARLRLHYADGSEASVPILTGRDVPGWAGDDLDVPVAWDYGPHLRLLGQPVFLPINNPRLPNPYPQRIVSRLDIESGSGTWNAPVIFAITAEPADPP